MQFSSHYIRRYFNAENGKDRKKRNHDESIAISTIHHFTLGTFDACFLLSIALSGLILIAGMSIVFGSTVLPCLPFSLVHSPSLSFSLFLHSAYGIARCSNASALNGIDRRAVQLKLNP